MTKRPKNYEPLLLLDMDFEEALSRFAETEKTEADELAKQGKKRSPRAKPPETKKASKPD